MAVLIGVVLWFFIWLTCLTHRVRKQKLRNNQLESSNKYYLRVISELNKKLYEQEENKSKKAKEGSGKDAGE